MLQHFLPKWCCFILTWCLVHHGTQAANRLLSTDKSEFSQGGHLVRQEDSFHILAPSPAPSKPLLAPRSPSDIDHRFDHQLGHTYPHATTSVALAFVT